MKNATFKIAAAAVAVASAFTTQAYAAGFMLTEQSAAGLGRAYAGIGVDGTDISGVFYNPSTMTLHKGSHFQAGFVSIGLDLPFKDTDGNTIDNGRYKEQPIPHGFMAKQMTENVWLGLGMTVPFGMGTEFGQDWAGKDRGIEATMLTFDVNPNIAWKINEKFSVGAGASIQYAKAQFVTNLPLKVTVTAPNPSEPSDSVQVPSVIDNRAKLEADNLAYGWNIGMMWTPTDNVRIGLSYRSEIEHNAEGHLNINPTLRLNGQQMSTLIFEAGTTVTAPAWAMLNAAWDINEKYSAYATFRWTDWSSFDELAINANGLNETLGQVLPSLGITPTEAPHSTIKNNWKDAYLFTIGADYRYNDKWTFRTGVAYETSPIDSPETRMAIIPDADRWWFSFGANYKYNDNYEFDVSFTHLRGVHERNVHASEAEGSPVIGTFDKLDGYLFGAQMQYHF